MRFAEIDIEYVNINSLFISSLHVGEAATKGANRLVDSLSRLSVTLRCSLFWQLLLDLELLLLLLCNDID